MMHDTLGSLSGLFGQMESFPQPSVQSPHSLRDQMLKPQSQEVFGPHNWEKANGLMVDKDLDERYSKEGRLDSLLPIPKEDSLKYYSRFEPFFKLLKWFNLQHF